MHSIIEGNKNEKKPPKAIKTKRSHTFVVFIVNWSWSLRICLIASFMNFWTWTLCGPLREILDYNGYKL